MSRRGSPLRLSTILFTIFLGSAFAYSQDVPLGVFGHWQHYNNAGWTAIRSGDYTRAEVQFDRAVEILRPHVALSRRLMARSCADLARVLYYENRAADAQALAEWALQVREADSKAKPDVLFQSLFLLAEIHLVQDHSDKAETLFARALDLQQKALGPDHYQIALTLDDMATVSVKLKKFTEAETFYRRAIAIHEKIAPGQSIALAETLEHYAALLRLMNRTADAVTCETRARANRSKYGSERAKPDPRKTAQGFEGFR
jgi:tetratricopeptide (TPR) repeat protein